MQISMSFNLQLDTHGIPREYHTNAGFDRTHQKDQNLFINFVLNPFIFRLSTCKYF